MLNWRTFWALAGGLVLLELALLGSPPSFAPVGEQQQASQSAYEGYSLTQSFSYRGFVWLIDWIERRHDFVAAAATVVIAIFTITLWRSTDALGEATDKQLKLTERALKLDQTPRLRIYQIAVPIESDKPLIGELIILNEGALAAKIKTGTCLIYPRRGPLPQIHPTRDNEGHNELFDQFPCFAAGEVQRWMLKGPSLSAEIVKNIKNGSDDWALYVIGLIRYDDELGHLHHTLFCRKYDPSTQRYMKEKDSDYEYTN
jgi:hypothetical protein